MTPALPLGQDSPTLVMGIAKSHLKELQAYIKESGRGAQGMLARVAGVSEPTFSKVLRGNRHFSADAAGRLAKVTGIPVEKLITDPNAARLLKLLGKRVNSSTDKSSDKSRVA